MDPIVYNQPTGAGGFYSGPQSLAPKAPTGPSTADPNAPMVSPPAVITGKAASKVVDQAQSTLNGISEQKSANTPPPSNPETQDQLNEIHDTLSQLGGTKTPDIASRNAQGQALDSSGALIPAPAGSSQNPDGSWKDSQGNIYGAAPSLNSEEDVAAQRTTALNDFNKAIAGITSGAVPLNQWQQAQLDSVKQQYAAAIQKQETANANYQGAITRAGVSAGRSRYAPEIEAGNIKSAIDEGIAKITDLNGKMAGTLSQLEQGFRSDNVKVIQDSYKNLTDYLTERDTELKNIQDKTIELNKQAQARIDAAKKQVSDLATDAAKAGAPQDVIKAISSSTNINDALAAAGDSLQTGSGIVGEYLYYKRQAQAAGQTPMDFNAYQNADANRKAKATAQANSLGVPTSFANGIADGKTGDALIATLNPVDRATIQSILDYTKNPSNLSLRKSAGEFASEREKFLGMAHLIDPSYDETQYAARAAIKKDFSSGKSAQNIKSLNTAVGHLDQLSKAADKLKNSGIPLLNGLLNMSKANLGDPNIVAFNNAATAVENELATVFKGTGATDQEITQWRNNLNSSQSPAQLHAAIETAIELMGSRMQALSSQYEQGLGKPKDFSILNDKSRSILQGLGADVDALDPVASKSDTNTSTGDSAVQSEKDAETKVTQAYTTHADAINKILQQSPNISNQDLLQILGI